ncbi:MAG: aspartyl protease family protein [Gemmataceae bacterium]|nr:aspartyl protease family protein [Gemmataceae bacterium]
MRFQGQWPPGPTGALRPIISAYTVVSASVLEVTHFLVDSGSTRTILSFRTADALGLLTLGLPTIPVEGVGGLAERVEVDARIGLIRETGDAVYVGGPYFAFTSPDSGTDDILGNDVIDNFDLILSYRRREVLLLALPHEAAVVGG